MPTNVRLIFPMAGVSDASAFVDQPPGTAPRGTTINVVPHDAVQGRYRGGSRPGLSSLFNGTLGNGPVQGLVAANRPSDGGSLVLGAGDLIAGSSKSGGTVTGVNYFFLDDVPSVELQSVVSVSADSITADNVYSVVACGVNENNSRVVSAVNYRRTDGYWAVKATCFNTTTRAVVWSVTISAAATNVYANSIACSAAFAFVATTNGVSILDMTDGTNHYRWTTGWAQEYIAVRVVSLTETGGFGQPVTTKYLYVAFDGSELSGGIVGGTLGDGTVIDAGMGIQAGQAARNYRAGVMRCSISETNPIIGANILTTDTDYNNEVGAADPRHETLGSINYHRLSFSSIASPHGAYIRAMWVDSDGAAYVVRSNQGYGPNFSFRPTPQEADPGGGIGRPYISVCKIASDGTAMEWESHAASSVTNDGNGDGAYSGHPHYNDAGPAVAPSFVAITGDNLGAVFVGGRCNGLTDNAIDYPDGYNVFALSAASGGAIWKQNVGSPTKSVTEGAMVVDSFDKNVAITGERNTDWFGSGGTDAANLWKLSAYDGAVVLAFDTEVAGHDGAVLAAIGSGRFFWGTPYV